VLALPSLSGFHFFIPFPVLTSSVRALLYPYSVFSSFLFLFASGQFGLTKAGNAPKAGIWNFVEPGLAITAGNLAVVRPLFRMVLRRLGLRTESGTATSNQIFPPTVGARDNGKGRKNDPHDSLDLLTYPGRSISSNGNERKPNYTATGMDYDAPNAVRRLSVGSDIEDQKEVYPTVTTETIEGAEPTPKSFIPDERGT
jgi:hypothetical protein